MASPGASPTTGAIPTSTQASGTNQGPADSPTPANQTGDSSNSGSNSLTDALPLILTGLGVIALLALLFIPVRILLRKRLVPLPSPNLPPSGAAPWSRSPASAQAQSGQPFPYAQPGNDPFYTPDSNGAPFPGNFNAAPALANASDNPWSDDPPQFIPQTPYTARPAYDPDNPWSDNPPQIGLHPASMLDMPAFSGNQAYPQPSQPFLAPPVVPITNGYVGLIQNQQPLPITPPLLSGVQLGPTGQQSGTPVSPAPPGYSLVDTSQPGDAVNSAARTRLRRDGLRTSDEHMALGGQISGDVSADMMVVSDPSLRTILQKYVQEAQTLQQAPEESDAR